jgi:hypothetical protein
LQAHGTLRVATAAHEAALVKALLHFRFIAVALFIAIWLPREFGAGSPSRKLQRSPQMRSSINNTCLKEASIGAKHGAPERLAPPLFAAS